MSASFIPRQLACHHPSQLIHLASSSSSKDYYGSSFFTPNVIALVVWLWLFFLHFSFFFSSLAALTREGKPKQGRLKASQSSVAEWSLSFYRQLWLHGGQSLSVYQFP
jgi:hypothetical protein